ncbi:MAG: hypothetical protein C4333_04800, partial [Meiothermus sp.]
MVSNAVVQQVLALSQEGKSVTEIARETGFPFRQVRSLLAKAGQIEAGEEQAEGSGRKHEEIPEEVLAQIEARYAQGETVIDIATSLELNYQRVLRTLRERGVLRQERRGRRAKGDGKAEGKGPAAEPSQQLATEVLELAQQGQSPVQIARATGLKVRQINAILQRG